MKKQHLKLMALAVLAFAVQSCSTTTDLASHIHRGDMVKAKKQTYTTKATDLEKIKTSETAAIIPAAATAPALVASTEKATLTLSPSEVRNVQAERTAVTSASKTNLNLAEKVQLRKEIRKEIKQNRQEFRAHGTSANMRQYPKKCVNENLGLGFQTLTLSPKIAKN